MAGAQKTPKTPKTPKPTPRKGLVLPPQAKDLYVGVTQKIAALTVAARGDTKLKSPLAAVMVVFKGLSGVKDPGVVMLTLESIDSSLNDLLPSGGVPVSGSAPAARPPTTPRFAADAILGSTTEKSKKSVGAARTVSLDAPLGASGGKSMNLADVIPSKVESPVSAAAALEAEEAVAKTISLLTPAQQSARARLWTDMPEVFKDTLGSYLGAARSQFSVTDGKDELLELLQDANQKILTDATGAAVPMDVKAGVSTRLGKMIALVRDPNATTAMVDDALKGLGTTTKSAESAALLSSIAAASGSRRGLPKVAAERLEELNTLIDADEFEPDPVVGGGAATPETPGPSEPPPPPTRKPFGKGRIGKTLKTLAAGSAPEWRNLKKVLMGRGGSLARAVINTPAGNLALMAYLPMLVNSLVPNREVEVMRAVTPSPIEEIAAQRATQARLRQSMEELSRDPAQLQDFMRKLQVQQVQAERANGPVPGAGTHGGPAMASAISAAVPVTEFPEGY